MSHDLAITRHALLRYCARVAPEIDGRTTHGRSTVLRDMRCLMDGKPLMWGKPDWLKGVGFYVDCGGGIVFTVARHRPSGCLWVTTVMVNPERAAVGATDRIPSMEMGEVA